MSNNLRQAAQAALEALDAMHKTLMFSGSRESVLSADLKRRADELRAALAEPQPALAEFVLVPREPTPEMVGAMAVEEATGTINGISTLGMAGAYLAWESALAAAPQAWQPLTEEQIDAIPCTDGDGSDRDALMRFARAIERAHGIGR